MAWDASIRHSARVQVRSRRRTASRRLLPLLGLCVLLLGGIGLCVVYALPRFRQMLQPNPQQESLGQARRIYNACQAFNAVRGKLPGTLEFLVPDFLAERRDAFGPAAPDDRGWCSLQ